MVLPALWAAAPAVAKGAALGYAALKGGQAVNDAGQQNRNNVDKLLGAVGRPSGPSNTSSAASRAYSEWLSKYYAENGSLPSEAAMKQASDYFNNQATEQALANSGIQTEGAMTAQAAANAQNTLNLFDTAANAAQNRQAPALYTADQQARQDYNLDAQKALVQQLNNQAQGYLNTPSVALAQLNAGADMANNQVASNIASQRGLTPAQAARMANNQSSSIMQQTNQQAAIIRAQEHQANLARQLQAQQMASGLLGNMYQNVSVDGRANQQVAFGQGMANDRYSTTLRDQGYNRSTGEMAGLQGFENSRTGSNESVKGVRVNEANNRASMANQATGASMAGMATVAQKGGDLIDKGIKAASGL